MEKLFHSKSHFWLCYCSPLQIMNHRGTLQPCRPCAAGDGLCHNMTVGMQISAVRQCTLTAAMCRRQSISQAAVRCRYFLPFSLQGLLLNSGLTLQSSRCQKYRNKKIKVRQGWVFFSLLLFFHRLPFGALWSTGCQTQARDLMPALLLCY